MAFSHMFTSKEAKPVFAHLLRHNSVEKEIQPVFAHLLRKTATLSAAELHPKYPSGTPGGKGGQFMPKGSDDYNHAIKDAKIHAKNLAEHIKTSGKDNDDTAKAWAGKVAEHVQAAHEKGVDPEHMAQELTDAGLTQWQKKKHDLPMTGKEKEFTDKAMAAAMKLYNKKMATKKLEEHKDLLAKAEEAKIAHGESSKEYKVLMFKANKAAAKAMEYGKEPTEVAQAPQEVDEELAGVKENKKKALYDAALISAKNSHLGITDTEHDQKHLEAFNAAKEHFGKEDLDSIQEKAVADNKAKVAQGIANIAGAKSYHAKYQQFKTSPYGSDAHNSYKRSAAEYQHHYNAGAEEHGLTAADKAEGVKQGYALHNAGKHGVQVIAPTGEPVHNQVEVNAEVKALQPVVTPTVAPIAAPVVPTVPQAAMSDAEKTAAYIKTLDTPSKIKNAIYSSSHTLNELAKPDASGNVIGTDSPKYKEALDTHKAVLALANANDIAHLETQAILGQGIEHSNEGKFKLPFKSKSKNKSKLPLAAQSAGTKLPDPPAEVNIDLHSLPTAQETSAANHADEGFGYPYADHPLKDYPELTSATDTKEIANLKKDAFDKATVLAKAITAGGGKNGSPESEASKEATQKLFEKTDYNTALDIQDAGGHHFYKALSTVDSHNPAPSNPYKGHPLAKHDHLVSSTNTPEMAKMKKDVYDASYHLMGVLANKYVPSNSITSAANELGKVSETLNANLSPEATVKALHIAEQASTDFKANTPEVVSPVAAPTTPATLATSMAATPKKVKPPKVAPEKIYTPLPTGTEGDPHGLLQLKTKQQAENALYITAHELLAAQKEGNTSKIADAQTKGNIYNNHFKSFIKGGWTPQHKQANAVAAKAKVDFAAGKVNIPNPLAKHLFETTDANAPFAVSSASKPKKEAQSVISSIPVGTPEDKFGLSQLDSKQKAANALYALSHLKNSYLKSGESSYGDRVSKVQEHLHAVSTHCKNLGMSYSARNKVQYKAQDDVQYHSNKFELPHPQPSNLLYAKSNSGESSNPVATSGASANTVDHVNTPVSLDSMPTDKTAAEDLNKTLAKNYYTLKSVHGSQDHLEVKAAYEDWNKLKDHMKSNMGVKGDYFNSTSGKYKSEVAQEQSQIKIEKEKQKQSAITGYKQVSNDYHALALAKGASHPNVIAAKAGLEKAALVAKNYLMDSDIQAIDSTARQGAEANLAKKKEDAVGEIHAAIYAAHMAESDKGTGSQEHLKAVNNANNIVSKHIAESIISPPDLTKAKADAKAKADKDIKAVADYKAAFGNPAGLAANYDATADKYKFLSGNELTKARDIGSALHASIPQKARDALDKYTGAGYKTMNKALAKEAANEDVKIIEQHIDKSLGMDMCLRRNMAQQWFFKSFGLATGTSSRSEMANIDPQKIQDLVGKVYTEPGFSSTSYDPHQTLMVSTEGQNNGALILKIRSKEGTAKGIFIDHHSNHSHEREVVLQKGATYVVRGIKKIANGTGTFAYEVDVDMIGHHIPKKA